MVQFMIVQMFVLQVGADISAKSGYLWPMNADNSARFEELWQAELAAEGYAAPAPVQVPVLFGRTLEVLSEPL